MPPLEWDKVMAAKPGSLSEDEVQSFYEAFIQVNICPIKDISLF